MLKLKAICLIEFTGRDYQKHTQLMEFQMENQITKLRELSVDLVDESPTIHRSGKGCMKVSGPLQVVKYSDLKCFGS